MEYYYEIILRTPMGNRAGFLSLNIEKDIVSGELDILKNKNPIVGKITENGSANILGKLVSPVSVIHFNAVGKITADNVEFDLDADGHHYYLYGKCCSDMKGE